MVSRETLSPDHFFDLRKVWFAEIFEGVKHPWELLAPKRKEKWIISKLKANIAAIPRNGNLVTETVELSVCGGKAIVQAGSYLVGEAVELRKGVVVEAGAWIAGPTILGEGTQVRHGAYVRGGVLTGSDAVIGHASEAKSSIFLNDAKAAHFAYLGDAILGNGVNLGAGTKVSNLKMTNDEVVLKVGDEKVPSGLRKFGAIIGDQVETGCNSVLNPGVLLGKKCMVYPAVSVRKNYYPDGSEVK